MIPSSHHKPTTTNLVRQDGGDQEQVLEARPVDDQDHHERNDVDDEEHRASNNLHHIASSAAGDRFHRSKLTGHNSNRVSSLAYTDSILCKTYGEHAVQDNLDEDAEDQNLVTICTRDDVAERI